MAGIAAKLAEAFDVRPRDPMRLVGELSGGNQQKVVLAKWFQVDPGLILLDEPTQGVDIGAREQVFQTIRGMSDKGACVICASSDHEQLAAICDRVDRHGARARGCQSCRRGHFQGRRSPNVVTLAPTTP